MAPSGVAGPSEAVEIEDVQGIILRGYSDLKHSSYLALRIDNQRGARAWLRDIAEDVTSAAHPVTDRHLNVAFTHCGLEKLGLPRSTLAGFRSAFIEGVAGGHGSPSHRSVALGDVGASASEEWIWGNTENPIHVALLLFARDEEGIADFTAHHLERLDKHGLVLVGEFPTFELPGRKEHFGFRDGISQPALRNANRIERRPGVLAGDVPANTVEPGEFLLGYRNHYGAFAAGPSVPPELDPEGLLPARRPWHGLRLQDFSRNGSYLVWRQLQQHVREFWGAVRDRADPLDPVARHKLAAKLVGRWPSGAPLSLAPAVDDPSLEDANDFLYVEDDPHGYRTPCGAHIRRANPRDWHLLSKPKKALEAASSHRIIRRGRPYGPPVAKSMIPEDILAADPERDEPERGLQFLAFMADIERQFEVIQSAWLDDPKFGGLRDEVDPLLGSGGGSFTIQATPIRQRLSGLSRYGTVRGAAYLFMPGLRAVRFLGTLRPLVEGVDAADAETGR